MLLATDQYGQRYPLKTEHPRKELLDYFGRRHAGKMYRDTSNGTRHVGYIIAGMWLEIVRVEPWKE